MLLPLPPFTLFFPIEEESVDTDPMSGHEIKVIVPMPLVASGGEQGKGKAKPSQAVIGENCFHCLLRRVFDRRLSSALFLIFFFQKVTSTPLSMPTPKIRFLAEEAEDEAEDEVEDEAEDEAAEND